MTERRDLYDLALARDMGNQCLRSLRDLYWALNSLVPRACSLTDAVEYAREVAERDRTSVEDWYVLTHLLSLARAWPEARLAGQHTIAVAPQHVLAHWNLGEAHLALGDAAAGRHCFERIAALGGHSPAERVVVLDARLLTGQFGDGWRDWSAWNDEALRGQRTQGLEHAVTRLEGAPVWRGEPVAGRLLLVLEHGHGDGFMMSRWISRVRERVGTLCVQVRPELGPLLSEQWQDIEVLRWDEEPPAFEYCCLSYSLPHLFGVESPDDVAAASPYLRAQRPFRALGGAFRVGLRWAGDPKHPSDSLRSTALADWDPILQVPGVTFYSLQVGAGSVQVQGYAGRVHDLGPEFTDWSETAAAVNQLDLVISVDTSVAHLAGALGRPVWICLSAVPEWRWMLERTDSPWYPTARLFRQPRVGNWDTVFETVAMQLRQLVARRGISGD